MAEIDPIAENEEVFRRIPCSMRWYDPAQGEPPSDAAFRPTKLDQDGLSLYRAKYMSAEECAAAGRDGNLFFVAILGVKQLAEVGMIVEADSADDPGHCLIRSMTHPTRKSDANLQRAMDASRIARVVGPFLGRTPPPPIEP